jgi:hypothetical protein
MSRENVAWEIRETVAMGIPNPRSVAVIPKPDWMSQEQFEAFAKELELECPSEEHKTTSTHNSAVEYRPFKARVAGSNPAGCTK